MNSRTISAIILLGAFLLSMAASADQHEKEYCLPQQESAEIADLMARHAFYMDAGSGEDFASTFTEHGALVFEDKDIRGRKALGNQIDRKAFRTLHLSSRPKLLKVADDRIHARSQMIYVREPGPDSDIVSAADLKIGLVILEDKIVRTSEGWKFAERRAVDAVNVSPEFMTPSSQCD